MSVANTPIRDEETNVDLQYKVNELQHALNIAYEKMHDFKTRMKLYVHIFGQLNFAFRHHLHGDLFINRLTGITKIGAGGILGAQLVSVL